MLRTSPTRLLLAPLLCASCLSFEKREVLPLEDHGTAILVVETPRGDVVAKVVDQPSSRVFVDRSERVLRVHHFECTPAAHGLLVGRFEFDGEELEPAYSWAPSNDGPTPLATTPIAVGSPLELNADDLTPLATVRSVAGDTGVCDQGFTVLGNDVAGEAVQVRLDGDGKRSIQPSPSPDLLRVTRSSCLGEVFLSKRELLLPSETIPLPADVELGDSGGIVVRCQDPPIVGVAGELASGVGVAFVELVLRETGRETTISRVVGDEGSGEVSLEFFNGDYYISVRETERRVYVVDEQGSQRPLTLEAFGVPNAPARLVRRFLNGQIVHTDLGLVVRRSGSLDHSVTLCATGAPIVDLAKFAGRWVFISSSGLVGWTARIDPCVETSNSMEVNGSPRWLRVLGAQALLLEAEVPPHPVVGFVGARSGSNVPTRIH